jgi:hypothetical protein
MITLQPGTRSAAPVPSAARGEVLGLLIVLTVPFTPIALMQFPLTGLLLWMFSPFKLTEHVPECNMQVDFPSTLASTWWIWGPTILASVLRKAWLGRYGDRPKENLASRAVGLVFPLMLVPFVHMNLDEAVSSTVLNRGAAQLILGPVYVTAALVFVARLRAAPATTRWPRSIAAGLCLVGAGLGLWQQHELGAGCHPLHLGGRSYDPVLTDWNVLLPGRLGMWLVFLAVAFLFANDPTAPPRPPPQSAKRSPESKQTPYRGPLLEGRR